MAALALVCGGCSRKGSPETRSAAEETAPALQSAFNNAPAEAKQQATAAVAAIQSQNDGLAFVQLESLSQRPGLTPEQRKAAVNSWMAINTRLRLAAANGNAAAQAILEKHQASK